MRTVILSLAVVLGIAAAAPAADPPKITGTMPSIALAQAVSKDGKITLFGQGEETRDHIPVDDVAALSVLVLRHCSTGTLNVATGRSISYAEVARKVAALFDKPIEIAGTARQTPITHRHFDVTALRKAFPTFVFTPLEDGLAKAHREMMEQG